MLNRACESGSLSRTGVFVIILGEGYVMGIFSRREKPVKNSLRIKVPADGTGLVQFTLDEPDPDGGSVWWACWANLMIPDSATEAAAQGLADKTVSIVRAQMPSMTEVHLEQPSGVGTLDFEGSATFLRSEWNAVKNLTSLGEMLMPWSREVVRLSATPVVLSAQFA